MTHNAGCECCTDPLDCTGSKITFHSNFILWRNHTKMFHSKLLSIYGMIYIYALCLYTLALIQICKNPCTCNLQLLHLEIDYAISILRIFIYNMLDKALQFLQDARSSIKQKPTCSYKQGRLIFILIPLARFGTHTNQWFESAFHSNLFL